MWIAVGPYAKGKAIGEPLPEIWSVDPAVRFRMVDARLIDFWDPVTGKCLFGSRVEPILSKRQAPEATDDTAPRRRARG